MSKKQIIVSIAIMLALSAGFVSAGEIDFTLIQTASLPKSMLPVNGLSLTSAAYTAMAPEAIEPPAPVVQAAPANLSSINIQKSFGPYMRDGSKFEKTLFTSQLVAMVALNVADYLTTKSALKHTGLQEGNPMMKPFVKNAVLFAAVKAGTTALSVWGMKSLRKRDKTTAWVLTTASNFLLSYVVANNMRLIQRAKLR
ncbi:MAG: DUF5658 family protein [Candidatus Aminicenantales bacterium]